MSDLSAGGNRLGSPRTVYSSPFIDPDIWQDSNCARGHLRSSEGNNQTREGLDYFHSIQSHTGDSAIFISTKSISLSGLSTLCAVFYFLYIATRGGVSAQFVSDVGQTRADKLDDGMVGGCMKSFGDWVMIRKCREYLPEKGKCAEEVNTPRAVNLIEPRSIIPCVYRMGITYF